MLKSPVQGINFTHPAMIEIAERINALTAEANKLIPERDQLLRDDQMGSSRFLVVDVMISALGQESVNQQRELREVMDAINNTAE